MPPYAHTFSCEPQTSLDIAAGQGLSHFLLLTGCLVHSGSCLKSDLWQISDKKDIQTLSTSKMVILAFGGLFRCEPMTLVGPTGYRFTMTYQGSLND